MKKSQFRSNTSSRNILVSKETRTHPSSHGMSHALNRVTPIISISGSKQKHLTTSRRHAGQDEEEEDDDEGESNEQLDSVAPSTSSTISSQPDGLVFRRLSKPATQMHNINSQLRQSSTSVTVTQAEVDRIPDKMDVLPRLLTMFDKSDPAYHDARLYYENQITLFVILSALSKATDVPAIITDGLRNKGDNIATLRLLQDQIAVMLVSLLEAQQSGIGHSDTQKFYISAQSMFTSHKNLMPKGLQLFFYETAPFHEKLPYWWKYRMLQRIREKDFAAPDKVDLYPDARSNEARQRLLAATQAAATPTDAMGLSTPYLQDVKTIPSQQQAFDTAVVSDLKSVATGLASLAATTSSLERSRTPQPTPLELINAYTKYIKEFNSHVQWARQLLILNRTNPEAKLSVRASEDMRSVADSEIYPVVIYEDLLLATLSDLWFTYRSLFNTKDYVRGMEYFSMQFLPTNVNVRDPLAAYAAPMMNPLLSKIVHEWSDV
jgi:hypothetical protein